MTAAGRDEAVLEELSLGDQALAASEALSQLALNHDALSRLYFAVFHWARALLASEGIEAKTHHGVQTLLGQHFIRGGRLEAEYQHTIGRLETWRAKADYARGFIASKELVVEELSRAKVFRARVHELLQR